MSKGLVRFKYKKDIIKHIEESWDYYGKEDEKRKVIKEIRNIYKIASSAKNAPKSEYEDKAKAFDSVLKAYDESLSEGHMADEVCNIIEKYNKQEELE